MGLTISTRRWADDTAAQQTAGRRAFDRAGTIPEGPEETFTSGRCGHQEGSVLALQAFCVWEDPPGLP